MTSSGLLDSDRGGRAAPFDVLSELPLDDGRRWGAVAEPWQRDDAGAVLDPDGPRLHYLTRSRGASKTTDTAAVALVLMLAAAPPRSRSFAWAVDEEQSGILLDALAGFVDRTRIGDRVRLEARRLVVPRTGATLEVQSSDAASAFGKLQPYLLLIDEFAQWPSTTGHRRLWSAIASTLVKPPRPRLVILTTAGDPVSLAHRVLVQARSSPRWRVSEVPGPCPWVEPDDLDEQERLLLPSEFERLHLNRWTAAEDRLVVADDLAACVGHSGPLPPRAGVRYRVGLDVGLVSDRTVATVAHGERVETDGGRGVRVVVDRQEVWAGSKSHPVDLGDVEAWLVEAHRAYNRAKVIVDPWQSVHLAQRLRARRVAVTEFTFNSQSVGRLAVTLFRLLRAHLVDLDGDDDELLDELANVRIRETQPGVYRIDHDPDRHDDRVISLALPAHELVAAASTEGRAAPAEVYGQRVSHPDRTRPSLLGEVPR